MGRLDPSGQHVGPHRSHPSLQLPIRQHDVLAAPRGAPHGRRCVASHVAGQAHRPRTGRLPALGWLPGRHRADHQLGPGHHPPLLHGRPGATAGRPGRHGHHGAVATPRLVGGSIGPGGGPGGHHHLGASCCWIALRPGSPGSASSWRWPAPSVPWPSSPSRGCAGCPMLAVGLVAVLGFGAALAAPLFSTIATAATPHSGAIPTVTPSAAGGFGGPGGGFGGFGGGGFRRLGGIPGGFPGGTRGGRTGWRIHPPGGFGPGRGTGGGFTPPAFAGGRGGTFGGGFGGGGGGRRDPGLEYARLGRHQASPSRCRQLFVGGRHHQFQLGRRLPVGQRRSRDGHRRLQRHRPGALAGPVRAVRDGGQDPLLHQWRPRSWRGRLRRRLGATAAPAAPPTWRRRSQRGSRVTSRPRRWTAPRCTTSPNRPPRAERFGPFPLRPEPLGLRCRHRRPMRIPDPETLERHWAPFVTVDRAIGRRFLQ